MVLWVAITIFKEGREQSVLLCQHVALTTIFAEQRVGLPKERWPRAGEMIQWLRVLAVFPEDPSSIPNTWQLKTLYIYSHRRCDSLF